MKIILIGERNLNESLQHYELKQIAKYLLWNLGYKHIATEVYGCYGHDDFSKETNIKPKMVEGCLHKNIIDVVGAKTKSWYNGKIPEIKIMGIEAKASKSDFRNGFCTGCEYTYIIAPLGIIPIEELPKNIGLIEVDLDNYTMTSVRSNGFSYTGITIAKRARSRLATRFKTKEALQKWSIDMVKDIAYRSTVENIYKNPRIKINNL